MKSKKYILLSLLLMGCSDLFFTGEKGEKEGNSILVGDSLNIPKDSIFIPIGDLSSDTVIAMGTYSEFNRSLKIEFTLNELVEMDSVQIVGKATSAQGLDIYLNQREFDSVANKFYEKIWVHEFSETFYKGGEYAIEIHSVLPGVFKSDFLILIKYDSVEKIEKMVEDVRLSKFQKVEIDHKIAEKSFYWREFNVLQGDNIRIKGVSQKGIARYLMEKSLFESFLKTGDLGGEFLFYDTIPAIDTLLNFNTSRTCVYLVENKENTLNQVDDEVIAYQSL